MNLLDLMVKISCDDQASGQVEGIGSRITGALGTAAKVGGAAVAALGTATIAIGKTALDAYANYEQLVGGMDTLFKGASATVQRYAANAYQTAGVSANRYMQITTSFAASLISSLGGDTAAAAEMANTAITDMSDNANKMGTSIETVQEAYMSLARGNYEMLDSLALGYAGTKTGLEQLLADAERYSAAQGEVRDFSVDSYADIVEAIHIVQTEMGITGTTAEEAASTIEGSINQMKAAWENWLAGLGNEHADMGALTDQLVDSVGTVLDNVTPRVGIIIGTLVTEIGSRGPEISAALQSMLLSAFSQGFDIVNTFVQENFGFSLPEVDTSQITSAVEGISTTVQDVVSFMRETFGPGIQQAMELVGPIVDQVGTFFSNMGSQVQEVLGPALEFLGQAFADAMAALEPWIEPLGNVANIFGNILVAAISAFVYAVGGVLEVFSVVTAAIQDLDNFLNGQPSVIGSVIQAIISWFAQLPGNIASFLWSVISSVASWVGQMAANAVQAGSQFLSNVASFLMQLPGQVAGFLGSVISNVAGFVGQMASNALRAGQQFLSNIVNELSKIPGRVFSIGSDIVSGVWNGIQSAAGWFSSQVAGFFGGIVDGAKAALGIASPSKVMRKEVGRWIPAGIAEGIDDYASEPVRSMDSVMRGIESSAVEYRPQVSVSGSEGASIGDLISAVDSLHSDLGKIIQRYAPAMTPREFRNAVNSVVRA